MAAVDWEVERQLRLFRNGKYNDNIKTLRLSLITWAKIMQKAKTYNNQYSLVVTHPTTNWSI